MVLYYHGVGLLTRGRAAAVRRRAQRQRVRRRRRARWCSRPSTSAAARGAAVLGEILGGGYASEGEGLLADPRRRRRACARDRDRARRRGAPRRRRRDDRRARQRHARTATRRRRAALQAVFGAAPPPVTAFKWAFGHLIAASGIVETVVALAALRERTRAGHRDAARLDPACAALPVSRVAASAAQRRRAHPLPRLRRHQRRAGRSRRRRLTRMAEAAGRGAAASTRSRSLASSACCARRRPRICAKLFSAEELRDAGEGPGRAASLAARFAAKEACLKLFPRETALGQIGAADFAVARDNYGAPRVVVQPAALDVLARNRVEAIALSLTHDRTSASAVALAEPARTPASAGRQASVPPAAVPPRRHPREPATRLRRRVARRRDHAARAGALRPPLAACPASSSGFRWCRRRSARRWCASRTSRRSSRRTRRARACSCSPATSATWKWRPPPGLGELSAGARPVLLRSPPVQARWLDDLVTRRFERAGFGVLPKRGSLEAILDRLTAGDLSCSRSTSMPAAGRRRGRLLRPPGRDLPQPGDHRAHHRRAGGAGGELARARRPPRAALRGAARGRSNPTTRTKPSGATRAPTTPRSSA